MFDANRSSLTVYFLFSFLFYTSPRCLKCKKGKSIESWPPSAAAYTSPSSLYDLPWLHEGRHVTPRLRAAIHGARAPRDMCRRLWRGVASARAWCIRVSENNNPDCLRVQKSMNDAESRRLLSSPATKSVGSFRKRVGRRVVFQLEISGKFSEIAEINSANSEVIIRPINQGSFGTFGTGRLQTLSRVLIGYDFRLILQELQALHYENEIPKIALKSP